MADLRDLCASEKIGLRRGRNLFIERIFTNHLKKPFEDVIGIESLRFAGVEQRFSATVVIETQFLKETERNWVLDNPIGN
jgi:hypothetical protein